MFSYFHEKKPIRTTNPFSPNVTPRPAPTSTRPKPLKKGILDSNAKINAEGSRDMSSTQNNQI